MTRVNLDEYFAQQQGNRPRYKGANVKFFMAYQENQVETQKQGRLICDEVPSISIQWPGQDETVRKIEPQDKVEYAEQYNAFAQGQEAPTQGTPLGEWAILPGSAVRELNYLSVRTVEQLAQATDDLKRKMGPLQKYCKPAKEWLDNADATPNQIVKLKEQLDRSEKRNKKLEEQVLLLMQRIEAVEGTRLHEPTDRRN